MASDAPLIEPLHADAGVIVGYQPGRPIKDSTERLVLAPGAHLRSGTVIYGGSHIGARFETGHNVVIREECVIGDDVCVWSNSVVDYGCRIGDGVKIHANCYLAQFTEISAGAFLAPGVTVANDLYPGDPASARLMSGPSIGPGARIGVNVTLLPYVRIGAEALVGAGAVVTRDVPDGCVAYGNPAMVHGRIEDLVEISRRVEAVPGDGHRLRMAHRRAAGSVRTERESP
ncbi:transferase family hexapeptide repeat protein [Kribbella antiqua]|uniref:Transferase family hexapeptide repeat protein n=1 Tax=Kribbella antiqua TaxID=2512217 RepID=A0A4R2ICN7_9ACTN|nr:acyltransferase [Kribbella antiqua]TCO42321.1 transferase family hexapeptide repeat protein [Kribbella antiqua]